MFRSSTENPKPKEKKPDWVSSLFTHAFTAVISVTGVLAIYPMVNPSEIKVVAQASNPTSLKNTPITKSIVTTDIKGVPTITQVPIDILKQGCQAKLEEIKALINSPEKTTITRSIEEAINSAGLKPQSTQNDTQTPEAQKPVEIVKIIPTYVEGGKTFLNLQRYESDLRKILLFYGVQVPTSGLSKENIALLRKVKILFSETKDGKVTNYISESLREELLKNVK